MNEPLRHPNLPAARRTLAIAVVLVSLLSMAACSTKKGPDLVAKVGDVPSLSRTSTPPAGLDVRDADATWLSDGSQQEVADVVSAAMRPDERTDSATGGTFLLYPQGTVWVTPAGGKTAVVVYKDNDKAYRRHSGVLLASAGWGGRMRGYDSGGGSSGSSGNGFRGGGSGSGK